MIREPHALVELARFASDLHDAVVAREALALREQLERRELNVLVVGQFKRGKSTIVNALLDEDLMPTGALPLTGIATAIRFGEIPVITVEFADGVERSATPEELATYVSERTNPRNAMGVARVDIVRPAQALRDIALFDTPGVGSIFEHNTATARSMLPRADAAILVVGPEPPIGAEELAYAREVAASSVQLFVLFNKADIAGGGLQELLDFTRTALRDVAGDRFTLFPMSALRAREEQRIGGSDPDFAGFVAALRAFVERRGTEALEASIRRRLGALLDRTATLLEIRERAIALPREERAQRRATVEKTLQALDDRVRLFTLAVDDDVRRLRLRLDDQLDRRYDREQSEFRSLANEIAAEGSRDRRHEMLDRVVAERAQDWRRDAVAFAESELAEYASKYVRLLGELEEAVIQAGCEALRIDGEALKPHEIAFAPAELTVAVSIDPSTGLEVVRDLLTDLLPSSVRKHVLQARLEHVLSTELDALRGKLRYGIAHDLEPWRRSVHETISSTLDATRSVVLDAFPETASSEEEQRERDVVRRSRERFAALRASLQGVPA